MRALLTVLLLTVSAILFAQQDTTSPKFQYQSAQRQLGREFSNYFYPNYASHYSLPEQTFLSKIDSARRLFEVLLNKYQSQLAKDFVADEKVGIKYYFDRLIIDYPSNHETYTSTPGSVSPEIQALVNKNLPDLNNPKLLSNSDLPDYVRAFFHLKEYEAHKKRALPEYRQSSPASNMGFYFKMDHQQRMCK